MSQPHRKRRRRQRSPFMLRVEHLIFRAVLRALAALGPRGPQRAARLTRLLAPLISFRRDVVAGNLRIAFPDISPREERDIYRATLVNSAKLITELARLQVASTEEIAAQVIIDADTRQRLEAVLAEGRGLMLLTGHLGDWEWMGQCLSRTYPNMGVVYKPMHNAMNDALLRSIRERAGLTVIATSERVPRELLRVFKNGGILAVLADQDARRNGEFIPFFGRPASTAMGPADLAVRMRAPVMISAAIRQPDGRIRMEIGEVIYPDPAADPASERRRIMLAYHAALERWIRLYPGQYFWWHRRWKTKQRTNAEC